MRTRYACIHVEQHRIDRYRPASCGGSFPLANIDMAGGERRRASECQAFVLCFVKRRAPLAAQKNVRLSASYAHWTKQTYMHYGFFTGYLAQPVPAQSGRFYHHAWYIL